MALSWPLSCGLLHLHVSAGAPCVAAVLVQIGLREAVSNKAIRAWLLRLLLLRQPTESIPNTFLWRFLSTLLTSFPELSCRGGA
jgi:hypothetical protein